MLARLGAVASVRPPVPDTKIFTARLNLEKLLAANRIPGRVELGSRKDHLQVWAHSREDAKKLEKLLTPDKIAGFTFEGFQVLILV